jgi:hypothetical protein
MSYDENQTFVPDSFIELFQDSRKRLTVPKQELAQRHEFCEDMAVMLTDTCRTIHFRDGVDEDTVLSRCHAGLMQQAEQFPEAQAWWVIRRAAELLQWDWTSNPRLTPQ